ncbi:potassium channel family protein [Acetivibrio straminisolvens]|jgi:trk system potassium uptake protein TrkA|uniref:Trk system potassium uptake protein TrkA n=1 Tax=Acetivibrio straminisolvens JCM 21531 TaxID=1294263 RepID=W4VA05_9FIRM|nr:TrkA family potassium uptake protein [Acetivibrio straminisolvens]GAE90017.1 Trk system potassium uptake protein TrkA [Acetivibrio straminisolvens JCM 21531]
MFVIVVGCGKVGSRFAQVLSEEGHDVVIIDNDPDSFKLLDPDFGGLTITGVPIDQDVLKKAGIQTADVVAAVTPDDNTNIMVSQMAKEIFKVPRVVARIYNPAREHVFHEFGLDTICPTEITVDLIRSMVLCQKEKSVHTIGNSPIVFSHQKVQNGDVGKKLGAVKLGRDVHLFGVIKDGEFDFPNPEMILSKNDVLVIASKSGQVQSKKN